MLRQSKIKKPPDLLIELRPSNISGVGVFAVMPIRKGRKIADGINEGDYATLVRWKFLKHFDGSIQEKVRDFCIGTPDGFIPPANLDFNNLSIEWYLNHSCDGNVGFNQDGDFVAIKDIRKGKELTYDYGLVESNPKFRMQCRCGSKNCREVITGNDWRDDGFRSSKVRYMLPALRSQQIPKK